MNKQNFLMDDLDYNEFYRKFDLETDPWTVVVCHQENEKTNYEHKLRILQQFGLQKNSTLLDVGCGTGLFIKSLENYLQSPQQQFVGVDLADDAIKYCMKKYPGYTFYTCGMTKLPILNKKFDMICLFSVFTHMYPEEILEYLKDMKNYLNENGCIVASIIESVDKKFNGDRNKAEINKQYFMEIVKSSGYDKIVQLESDEYYEALKKTGNVVQITYKISR